MPKHEIKVSFTDDSGSVPINATDYIVDDEVNALLPVAAGAVNTHYVIAFPHSTINDYILAVGTQSAAQKATGAYSIATAGSIALKGNSITTPVPNLTIQAGAAHVYAPAIPGTTDEFTADETDWYLSNPGTVDLVLIVKIGENL